MTISPVFLSAIGQTAAVYDEWAVEGGAVILFDVTNTVYSQNYFNIIALGATSTVTSDSAVRIQSWAFDIFSNIFDAATEAPSTPVLSAIAGIGQISLSWTTSPKAVTYTLYRALISGGPYTGITATNLTSFVDTNVVDGVTYYYVVTALSQNGESPFSNQVSATPLAPPVSLLAPPVSFAPFDGIISRRSKFGAGIRTPHNWIIFFNGQPVPIRFHEPDPTSFHSNFYYNSRENILFKKLFTADNRVVWKQISSY